MRKLVNGRGAGPSTPSDIYGQIIDGQTYVDEFLFDMLYSIQHLANQTGTVQNDKRDTLGNGFQIFEAWQSLARQNTLQYRQHSGVDIDPDFDLADLTLDSTERELDLSSIIPANAKSVLLRMLFSANDSAIGNSGALSFAKDTFTNNANVAGISAMNSNTSANLIEFRDITIFVDDDRKVKYYGYEGGDGFEAVSIYVGGWSF